MNEDAPIPGVAPDEQSEKESLGRWLDEPDGEKVAREMLGEWNKQNFPAECWAKRAKISRWWRMGYRDVVYQEDEDRSEVKAYLPQGSTPLAAAVNKVDRLCRRMASQLTVDAPKPECEPASDQDEDLNAAEFSTRFLTVDGSEAGTDDQAVMEYAVDRSSTWASDFTYVCIDPQGGGSRPKPMQLAVGPETRDGYQKPFQKGMQSEEERFTEDPGEAEQQTFARFRVHHLHPPAVRLIPEFSESLKAADGILLTLPMQLGTLREQCPEIDALSDQDLRSAASWRPPKYELSLDPYQKKQKNTPELKSDKRPPDETVFWPVISYFRKCYAYPKGACLYMIGGKHVVYRKPWVGKTPHGTSGQRVEEVLDIPVQQWRQLPDTLRGDPMGNGVAGYVGPIDEGAQSLLAFVMDNCYRAANPNVFAPIGSNILPQQLGVRDGSVLEYQPGVGNPIIYEQVPDIPPQLIQMLELLWEQEDKEIGLDAPAQGATDSSVTSNVQTVSLIQQSLIAISQIRRGVGSAMVEFWRCKMQLARAFFSGPQMMKYQGEDGAYKLKDWMATDLGSTKDVKIARGSFTMMSDHQKNEYAAQQRQLGLVTDDDYLRTVSAGVSAITGIQDDPNRQRVKRQIAEWLEGPQPEVVQAQQMAEQQMAAMQPQLQMQAQQAAMQGVPAPQPPPSPMMQAVAQIFEPLPVDDEPLPARVRHAELSRTMAGTKYGKLPKPWQEGFVMEYQRAKLAAGVMTIPEQQQQAAMQQQQQQASQEKDRSQKEGQQNADRELKRETRDVNNETALEKQRLMLASAS